jgi:hypothetical protein
MEDILKLVGIRITPECHKTLNQMALNRSAQLGRRVSTGFVVQELIEERLQLEHPETRSADLFGSHE